MFLIVVTLGRNTNSIINYAADYKRASGFRSSPWELTFPRVIQWRLLPAEAQSGTLLPVLASHFLKMPKTTAILELLYCSIWCGAVPQTIGKEPTPMTRKRAGPHQVAFKDWYIP
jgi:hypothetical protein